MTHIVHKLVGGFLLRLSGHNGTHNNLNVKLSLLGCRTLYQYFPNEQESSGTCCHHGCWISTDHPLRELRRGWFWCRASAPFPHCTLIIFARSRVQTIHQPSVQHTPPVWNEGYWTASEILFSMSHVGSLLRPPPFLVPSFIFWFTFPNPLVLLGGEGWLPICGCGVLSVLRPKLVLLAFFEVRNLLCFFCMW
jgi:hypothetical protein